ncbi:hypothetical protein B9Z55_012798 [Caenorhabditis nigoni]|nr:hypothetical protein B9Z55_012798 [Caenorhabditis nigoni]
MTETSSTEPIYDTNWCNMPAEIKSKCISKMMLKERLSLRCTAKAERSLVDCQKIGFYRGRIRKYADRLVFSFYHDKSQMIRKRFRDTTKGYEFLNYICKVGVFENLMIAFDESAAQKEFEKYTGEITAKHVNLEYSTYEMVLPILLKMKDGVESIMMYDDGGIDYIFDEILAISNVQNARYWHVQGYHAEDSLYKIWIDEDSKIGSTFQVFANENGSFNRLLMRFADRLVSKDERRVRIRTDNPDRHILLERGLDETVGIDYYDQYFRLMMISAEMKKSEYDDNCKEWIHKIRPGIYGEYSDLEYNLNKNDDFLK